MKVPRNKRKRELDKLLRDHKRGKKKKDVRPVRFEDPLGGPDVAIEVVDAPSGRSFRVVERQVLPNGDTRRRRLDDTQGGKFEREWEVIPGVKPSRDKDGRDVS